MGEGELVGSMFKALEFPHACRSEREGLLLCNTETKEGDGTSDEFQHALTVWYLTRSEPAHIFHQLLFGILFG